MPDEDVGVGARHHDRPARPGELVDDVVGRVHSLEVAHDRERPVKLELFVEMDGIGGEHDCAVAGVDHRHLLARRVSADRDRKDTVEDLFRSVGHAYTSLRRCALYVVDVARLRMWRELRATCVRACPELQLT